MKILKRYTVTCKKHKVNLDFKQMHGMRLIREVKQESPKRNYWVHDAYCHLCSEYFEVKSKKPF